jgi:hypothetical protein
LFIACKGGHVKIVEILLDNKADVTIENANKEKAIYFG